MSHLIVDVIDAAVITLVSKLSEIVEGIDALQVALNALEVDTEAVQAELVAIKTKLGGGLPSVLNSDRLRVTGLL